MSAVDLLASAALGGAAALAATLAASALPGLRLATRRAVVLAGLLAAALAPALAPVASWLGLVLRPATTSPTTTPAATGARRAGPAPGPVEAATVAEGSPDDEAPAHPASPSPTSPRSSPLPWPHRLAIVWLAGTAVSLVRLGAAIARLRSLRATLRPPGDPRLAGFRVSDALRVPATVGLLSPVVAIPARLARDLSDDDLSAVRRHEASHVARRDPLAGLLARVVGALHWPNPLAHAAARRLDRLCEAIADAEAVGLRPTDARRYAGCLLRIAERATAAPAPAGVHGIVGGRRALTRRVEALLDPRGPRDPRATRRGRAASAGVAVLSTALAACCCRAPSPAAVPAAGPAPSRALSVEGFSPMAAPSDPGTGEVRPTFTDGRLVVNADPACRGRIAVLFRPGTRLDPRSVLLGGDPALGPNLAALQILRFVPGTGNVPLPTAERGVEVLDDRIVFTPARLPLPDGQYSIGVFAGVRDAEGRHLAPAPVFHSFLVGPADTIAPALVVTAPSASSGDVGAGLPRRAARPSPRVSGAGLEGGSPDVVIRFTEPIAARSVTPDTIRVVDAGAFVPEGGETPSLVPAPGYPRLRPTSEGGSGGVEVVWRADPSTGGLPFGTRVRVTVVGADGGAHAASVTDVAGNPLPRTYEFEFTTATPPPLPAGR